MWIDDYTLPRSQIVERFSGKFSIIREFVHSIIHIAVGCGVGKTLIYQGADHSDHFFHMLGSSRLAGGRHDTERRGIFLHRLDKTGGQRFDRLIVFLRAFDNFVVNVSDIAHISNIKTALP